MRRTTLVPILLAATFVLAACGGDDAAAAPDGDGVTVVATEFEFEPSSVTLPADEDVELTLDNQGVVEHDIVVEELGDDEVVYAAADETATATVNIAAGTYTIYCSIPGHRDAGMEGTLIVE